MAMSSPSLEDALDRAHRLGADRLAVVPLFLFPGVLVDRIGDRATAWAAARPGVTVATAGPLGADAGWPT